MGDLLRCVDRTGRDVVLSEEAWFGRILRDHAMLGGYEGLIQVVVQDPNRVTRDLNRSNRECFYRQGVFPDYPRLFLKVVVEFRQGDLTGAVSGYVVTAYPLQRVRSGEEQLWP